MRLPRQRLRNVDYCYWCFQRCAVCACVFLFDYIAHSIASCTLVLYVNVCSIKSNWIELMQCTVNDTHTHSTTSRDYTSLNSHAMCICWWNSVFSLFFSLLHFFLCHDLLVHNWIRVVGCLTSCCHCRCRRIVDSLFLLLFVQTNQMDPSFVRLVAVAVRYFCLILCFSFVIP